MITPEAAAALIRRKMADAEAEDVPPEHRHRDAFLTRACELAGVAPSRLAIERAHEILTEAQVSIPTGDEYPQWVDGQIVNSAEEHNALLAEKDEVEKPVEPEPLALPAPTEADQEAPFDAGVPVEREEFP